MYILSFPLAYGKISYLANSQCHIVCSILYQSFFRAGYAMETSWLYVVRADDVLKFVGTGKAAIMIT